MNLIRLVSVLCFVTASPNFVGSAETPRMSAEDFALDYKKYPRQFVTIENCLIYGAQLEFAHCFGGMPLTVLVHYGNDRREVRRRAVVECTNVQYTRRCLAHVTGRVTFSKTDQLVVELEQATVKFLVP